MSSFSLSAYVFTLFSDFSKISDFTVLSSFLTIRRIVLVSVCTDPLTENSGNAALMTATGVKHETYQKGQFQFFIFSALFFVIPFIFTQQLCHHFSQPSQHSITKPSLSSSSHGHWTSILRTFAITFILPQVNIVKIMLYIWVKNVVVFSRSINKLARTY